MPISIERPATQITPDKTLFIGGAEADRLPDEMIEVTAYHFLRVALDQGCAKIVMKRGRWAYEFSVADMLRRGGQVVGGNHLVKDRSKLGQDFLPMELAGSWKDRVNF